MRSAVGPYGIPWSSAGAVLAVLLAVLLAVGWALWDRSREGGGE